ncbi:septum site-determining protein MinC [Herbaspirillum sp. RTI4]|uniref:septum site-determining protein MinC n=1 Tax=Herbaspirillum sp. RTI4 TaxID=3048640 RepID=UPI002AB4B75B|nr:septum site-determining protein MinC [Herbaspirillum sp. RTI4]MDY7576904.1 septum site-determining protein MinC [Herbaspirillum sp. RTI4]MEA9982490.1 septum site-determining protein MinC [Herbaspirillum sp. RTI4]
MQKHRSPIEIKIATVVAVAALLHATDPAELKLALDKLTGGSADFFEDEFAIFDIGALESDAAIDWAELTALFKRYRLHAVAVRNAAPQRHAAIVAAGLSIDTVSTPAPAAPKAAAPVAAPVAPAAAAPSGAAMIIDTPVRAGTRIYARGVDLIVMAAVNNGAEIIADGNIHVYAPLRGRALAGASGNTEARIFCSRMEAELVSIAGVYRTFDNGVPAELAGQRVQVRLVGERIDVLPLPAA